MARGLCVCVCVCGGGGGGGRGGGGEENSELRPGGGGGGGGERTQNSEVYYIRIKILGSCHSEYYKFLRCYFHSVLGCTHGGV